MPLPDLWHRLLRSYGRLSARRRLWFAARRMEVLRELRPGADELFQSDIDLLGELTELPHWQAFLKYQNIERWSTINNGLVHAGDLLQIGEVKGDIGRLNKIESDMGLFFREMQERRKQKTLQKGLAEEEPEEQDEPDFIQ